MDRTQTRWKCFLTHRPSVTLSACSAPILRKDDYIRKKEEERIAKEEADKKKAEEAAKKAEEKKKKDEEKRIEAERKAAEEKMLEEVQKKVKYIPEINWSYFDIPFRPIEVKMNTILGNTLDPLGEVHTGNRTDVINWTHKL